jgi:hypothetical protein
MHVRDLVDLAGLVALNGPLLIHGPASTSQAHLEQYWATSKCRFDSWNRALRAAPQAAVERSAADCDRVVELRAVFDEIFVGEILTRVWSAVLVARDRRSHAGVDEPLARSVLGSHVEARNRALELLLKGHVFSARQAVSLNRLLRRTERWTDVLIGGLLAECDALEFAVDAERAADFASELARRRAAPGGTHAWRLTLTSLRNSFQRGLAPMAANPDANARITASILGCFPGELFDSTGLFRSLWMMRLSAVASDAQGLIDDLLGPPPPVEPGGSTFSRRRLL